MTNPLIDSRYTALLQILFSCSLIVHITAPLRHARKGVRVSAPVGNAVMDDLPARVSTDFDSVILRVLLSSLISGD